MDRRTFIPTSAATLPAGPRAAGANDRIQIAIVGAGGRGRDHISVFGTQPDCRVAAVCDVDQARAEQAAQLAERVQGIKPKAYQDLQRLLEDKGIDAVSIITCNHWHALATIWACEAQYCPVLESSASWSAYEH